MPRQARKQILAPATLYHIVCRGNNQKRIFRSVKDYNQFLKILKKVKADIPFYLYSYSLLPNHYHLEVESRETPISKVMHHLNFLYARYFHHRYHTSGHLFQGRFYSNVIDKDSYFWEVSRYINLNAFRAGLIKKPEDYKWSSYPLYYKNHKNQGDDYLVDKERFLKYHGDDLERSRLLYLRFVEQGVAETRKPDFILDKNMV
jgi:REP element-mobilizing transposase RayT